MSIRNFVFATLLMTTAVSVGALTPQQDKMFTCNGRAKEMGLTGDARGTFMKTCLSNAPAAPAASALPATPAEAAAPAASALTPQQEKMKSCNANATTKNLKGADRKTYMKICLSGS